MNSTATYKEPVNRIKQQILFDSQLDNISHICWGWEDFLIETSEYGIKFEGVENLTEEEIARLDKFIITQNGYIKDTD
tara:strand:- start:690 stop:923 length:234 start_codon:yes stop_codon:yes gene_type:complete